MDFTRRDLLRASGAVLATAGTGISPREAQASSGLPPDAERTASGKLEKAPEAVQAAFKDLLQWMVDQGWSDYLIAAAGLDLEACLLTGDAELMRALPAARNGDFSDFGGVCAIQAGDPAMSLLYHALVSHDVRRGSAPSAYPSLSQIDALENYIYARAPLLEAGNLELAVFAYEYRHSAKTPHRQHADLVYARTGVARTGTHPAHWDPRSRSFVNRAEAAPLGGALAVTPARYALFLAKRVRRDDLYGIGRNSMDDKLDFLLPVRKLYDGCPHLHGHRLTFAESHRDEKLARLATRFVKLPSDSGLDPAQAPFIRESASRASPGRSESLGRQGDELARIGMMTGSALVTPSPRALVEEAWQGDRRLRFIVPPAKERHLGLTSNRRYSTLKLVEQPLDEAIDFILSDFVFGGGRYTTGLRSPRNGPVFINIRHKVLADGSLQHIGNTRGGLHEVKCGGYEAAMFLDGLCDGCVEAELAEPADIAARAIPDWLKKTPLAAYSIVAAPDFFPRFDPVDLNDRNKAFLEGGPETASGGRLPANPNIRRPGRPDKSAFPPDLLNKTPLTITAAVAAPPQAGVAGKPRHGRLDGINTLPDTVSYVFAPGWDVTYARSRGETPKGASQKVTHYATFGLGSPFPEDMKLCAAANGMWAGSSPDASRTFYPDLEPIPVLGRPATAVPLTDYELGYHGLSPAVKEHEVKPLRGWDGEFGPFIEIEPGAATPLAVNYADMMLSDYVVNTREGWLDPSRMRHLAAADVIERMDALRDCIAKLPPSDHVRNTKLWLISAEKVERWSDGAGGLGIPRMLGGRDERNRIPASAGIRGPGWLYVFAIGSGKPRDHCERGRRVQPCRRFYVCRVSGNAVSYGVVEGTKVAQPVLRWI